MGGKKANVHDMQTSKTCNGRHARAVAGFMQSIQDTINRARAVVGYMQSNERCARAVVGYKQSLCRLSYYQEGKHSLLHKYTLYCQ